jgi:hypothetical protein
MEMEDSHYMITMRSTVQLSRWLWEHPSAKFIQVNTTLGFWRDFVLEELKISGAFKETRDCYIYALRHHPVVKHISFHGSSYMNHIQLYSLTSVVASHPTIQSVSLQVIPMENIDVDEKNYMITRVLEMMEMAIPRLKHFQLITSCYSEETEVLNEKIRRVLRLCSKL